MRPALAAALLVSLALVGPAAGQGDALRHEKEVRLANIRQLTFGGENAEAYFDRSGEYLIFQSTRPPYECDQIFTMKIDGTDVRLVSTGKGRTTCSYFFPGRERILYSSTHHRDPACPPRPDFSQGYVWPLHGYDIFTADGDGTNLVQLTDRAGYDAEATLHPDGSRIVFTSTRDGDLDIYTMKPDGTDVRRLTDAVGYDGGPFYSEDGTKIVFRANHPETPEELARYKDRLARDQIEPFRLDLYVMNADGSDKRRLTDNGAANFCPFFHPDGQRILFSSNMDDPTGREFDIYMIGVDGRGLERITWTGDFDGFPMFSPDGKRLVWASNRHNEGPHDTNVFLCDWIDEVGGD